MAAIVKTKKHYTN